MGTVSSHKALHLNMTMQLLVMCDKTLSSPCSNTTLCNGDVGIPVVSLTTSFEDVEKLKMKISAQTLYDGDHVKNIPKEDSCDSLNGESHLTCENKQLESEVQVSSGTLNKSEENHGMNTNEGFLTSNHLSLKENSGQHAAKDSTTLKGPGQGLSISCIPQLSSEPKNHVPKAGTNVSGSAVNDLPLEVGASARFSKVLENISLPLLYIPTTKQLVTTASSEKASDLNTSSASAHEDDSLNKDGEATSRDFLCNDQESLSSPNQDLSSSALLAPPLSMHRAHSTQEFHCMGKFPDTDRLTLHSVDSFQGLAQHLELSGSNTFGDNSSLSSVSTGTDFSVSAVSAGDDCYHSDSRSLSQHVTDESLFMDISLHTRNSFDKGRTSASLDGKFKDEHIPVSQAAKKTPLIGLKNLFSKRAKEESAPGWKLFGKVPPKSVPHRNAKEITSEFQARQRKEGAVPVVQTSGVNHGTEVMSTTALILENRPTNLPCKSPEEAEKHRQQYEEMIEAAKRKEQKDIKMKKKQLQQQRKLEDQLMSAARLWNSDILPNWDAMRNTKKARDLWWQGLPPNVRGKVWKLAIGNDLNITHELYEICHERAEDRIKLVQAESGLATSASEASLGSLTSSSSNKESSVKVIKLDVSRTFPQLCIFQKGGPYYDLLHSLLGAYACYRPDVGYVQGMSFIAAILLLNMDVADAFVCFANLLNRPCQVTFFRMDENMMTAYYRTFEEFFKENLPKLYAHFNYHSVTPNLYLMEWVFLLYSKSLPLDVACRVWDVFCRDGEEFLFRTAIGILKLYEVVLMKMDFIHMAQFLTKLPEDICADHLFKEVDGVRMNIDKRGFHAVHAFFKDLHENTSLS
ncbi:TBC1 domain family member 12 [Aplysia californica]|uniref:TBC1 domain family member 12 n=1 Tax=Aplysia californica TaxID=6500 RepID=A0ABM0JC79_APLCA|nr:TBC1 domain family member 12 [Aplysia californica]XP_005090344.1 TBC1 domain family member 12 [Aplysia californica]